MLRFIGAVLWGLVLAYLIASEVVYGLWSLVRGQRDDEDDQPPR